MVQNLRAYFIRCATTIKLKMSVQAKIERFRMSQRSRLSSAKISGDIAAINCKKFPRGGKKLLPCCLGVAFTNPCHPMATDLGVGKEIY